MEQDKLLVYSAVALLIFSLISVILTFNSFMSLRNSLTGFATENGTIIVTITNQTLIEIYSTAGSPGVKVLNWGSGNVLGGQTFALLQTNGSGLVSGGSWSVKTPGFLIRNIGNTKVNLSVSSNVTASTFLGGTSPEFKFIISNYEANSCSSTTAAFNTLQDFSTSPITVCNAFEFGDSNDELRLDVLLKIPSDSLTGTRSANLILTYFGV